MSCVAWVVVDVAAIARPLAYEVPESLAGALHVGSEVKVPLRGRKMRGWVLAVGSYEQGCSETLLPSLNFPWGSRTGRFRSHQAMAEPMGRSLEHVLAISGEGLNDELVELCSWAAWRWAGSLSFFLDSASPRSAARRASAARAAGAVAAGRESATRAAGAAAGRESADSQTRREVSSVEEDVLLEVASTQRAVLRLGPRLDPGPWLADLWQLDARRLGEMPAWLVLAPTQRQCDELQASMAASGVETSQAKGLGGYQDSRAVIGTRGAVWTPMERLTRIVVLGSHDPRLKEERAPTWEAWLVATRRAESRKAASLLISPCPTLQQLHWGRLITTSRATERRGWAPVIVEDLSKADPREGLVTEGLLGSMKNALASGGRVVAVLNRKGRSRRLVCKSCKELVRCSLCGAGMEESAASTEMLAAGSPGAAAGPSTKVSTSGSPSAPGVASTEVSAAGSPRAPLVRALRCPSCGETRPWLCAHCGRMELAGFSPGVSKVRELLEAALRVDVAEVSADHEPSRGPDGRIPRVLIGTEAVLHRVGRVELVAFLDFDSQLLAPGWRTNEKALGLLSLGISRSRALTYLQTSMPSHPVVRSCVLADPSLLAEEESPIRKSLLLPPYGGLARISGPGASEFTKALSGVLGLSVQGPDPKGAWLIKAASEDILCDALSSLERPRLRCRIEVDPI